MGRMIIIPKSGAKVLQICDMCKFFHKKIYIISNLFVNINFFYYFCSQMLTYV